MAYEHKSGLPGAYDRASAFPTWDSVVTREGHIGQAAEMIEAQTIAHRKLRAVGDLVARDGDRVEGADIIIDPDAGTVSLVPGRIYVAGRVLDVPAAMLVGVPMVGAVSVGVRLVQEWLTEIDEPALHGLHPGSMSEGEPGAARGIVSLQWGFAGDGGEGDLYQVYLLKDGVAIDQTPPPNLTGINAQLAVYDYDANGNYIVTGCRVTALGKDAGDQVFSIEAGVANINGFKRTRDAAMRHREEEQSDLSRIPTEVHTFGANPTTLTLNHAPIATINEVLVEKEVTETVTRGGTGGGLDTLANTGVTAIMEVKQGGTTYAAGTDYARSGDRVSWAPGGSEPAAGSSYTVKYRFLGAVLPTEITATTIRVAGGVNGGQVHVDYDFQLPRIDVLGLDEEGAPVYIKGISSRSNPLPPQVPADVLALAMIENRWGERPAVRNIGVRAYTMAKIDRMYNSLIDLYDLTALERLQRDIDSREPISKHGVFVDPFTSDRYRDQGEAQTAAVFDGLVRLAIDPAFHSINLPDVALLDWTEQVAIEQPLATRCTKINPYMNFEPMPAQMRINPPVDYWTQTATEWTSDSTQAVAVPVDVQTEVNRTAWGSETTTTTRRQTAETSTVDQREELLQFLRQIEISYSIEGFFAGEILEELSFDDLDITPAGPVTADPEGRISGTFTIPQNVTAGSKLVYAKGAGGSEAEAVFIGQGSVEITTLRRVITTTVSRDVTVQRNPPPRVEFQWSDSSGSADPIAQTFMLVGGRHIAGVNVKVCQIGNPDNSIVLEIVEVENGIPTRKVISQALQPMHSVVIGEWTKIRLPYPVWLSGGVEYAFVIKTDDADHSIHTAALGDFDTVAQMPVASQPYAVGTMLTSANARTWTPHQGEDVTFQLIEARFAPATKTVDVGTFAAVDMSDLVIRADVELPTAAASMHFEVELSDGSITILQPGQAWERQDYYSGPVQVRAVLMGSERVSPVLFPVVLAVSGKVRTAGTYITRAFDMGTAIKLISYLKTNIPSGAAITLEADAADDNWTTVPQVLQSPLTDPRWIERRYQLDGHDANPVGRLRITLTGTPSARPMAYDFRAISAP
ncbi:DUF4815 domain-containing protein [Nitratireductor aquibiodomus]|uniref:DUF4815 domain-containing protein n=1 Tax=Nitratireductor aquibiodomus TaxID=204799 RepID=UPI0019D326D3|nr:DUF4815 domain-containing protein [Nitratireductor aquibiodomus]MBN7764055.1 DUF4815 domain-containing protein [Nitratireductor aquibiodomus]